MAEELRMTFVNRRIGFQQQVGGFSDIRVGSGRCGVGRAVVFHLSLAGYTRWPSQLTMPAMCCART
jgi:hypothetical protein